ncbi:HalOD1 output domain-containing protein [Natrarchaeobius chitinivorans]|uniref:HalOD1 output domain-containing protein n=1 Tax=Natrarchaeobius chitinivorans TaxID=1679083 RepID=UPI0014045326
MTHNTSPNSDTQTASPPQDRTFAPERSVSEFESVEYHPEDKVYRLRSSDPTDSATKAVVSAVAAVSDTNPLDVDPLHSTIDPDALNELSTPRSGADGALHITFEYHGYEVTASSHGEIEVRPLESPEPQTMSSRPESVSQVDQPTDRWTDEGR